MRTHRYWSVWVGFGLLSIDYDIDRIAIGGNVNYARNGRCHKDEAMICVCIGPFAMDVTLVMPWSTSSRKFGHKYI
jgi:hypothetical protein